MHKNIVGKITNSLQPTSVNAL